MIWTIEYCRFEEHVTVAMLEGEGDLKELRKEFDEAGMSTKTDDYDRLGDFLDWITKEKGWRHTESECLLW